MAIINDRADGGESLSSLVDEFRRGRDARELLPLLRSKNHQVVAVSAWILSELQDRLYRSEELVSTLWNLTEHEAAMVRFYALGASLPFFNFNDPAARTRLFRLTMDENDGVRMVAEAAMERLGDSDREIVRPKTEPEG